jgi:N-acetylneuraminate synthase/N,N'-diacetyllegionaminate synthase
MKITIGSRKIGDNYPLFFIAEAGVNHNGDLNLAKQLIDAAVDAKADAVKFQTFKADDLNIPSAPKASYHIETTGSDKDQSWYDLLKSQEISYEMHHELINYCNDNNIMFLSTPYSNNSVDLLENFDIPAYKIASADINNLPFLEYVVSKGKPIIISTGMSNMDEIKLAREIFIDKGLIDYVFLHCTSNYPAKLNDSNLLAINIIKKELNCLVGYSDHTNEFINPIVATALGACVYEKHFTLNKNMPGPDHRMSLDPTELKQTIKFIRMAESCLGNPEKIVIESERDNRIKIRKSIVANIDIKKGQLIKESMLGIKRPGYGIPPSEFNKLIGKIAVRDIDKNRLIDYNDLVND